MWLRRILRSMETEHINLKVEMQSMIKNLQKEIVDLKQHINTHDKLKVEMQSMVKNLQKEIVDLKHQVNKLSTITPSAPDIAQLVDSQPPAYEKMTSN